MKKVVIITGSSGDIGSALVKQYIKDNYIVIGLDKRIKDKPASKLFFEIKTDLYKFAKNHNYRNDIFSEIASNLPSSIKKFIIINNAAIQLIKNTHEITYDDWDESFTINTVSPFFIAQSFINELKSSKGHIINISSIHSKLTKSKFTCYAASKAALDSLTRSLSLELSQFGVSVNSIAPAAIKTTMLFEGFKGNEDLIKSLKDHHPSKSIGTPKELSLFVKSITDQDSTFITGSIFEFNGGISSKLSDPIND